MSKQAPNGAEKASSVEAIYEHSTNHAQADDLRGTQDEQDELIRPKLLPPQMGDLAKLFWETIYPELPPAEQKRIREQCQINSAKAAALRKKCKAFGVGSDLVRRTIDQSEELFGHASYTYQFLFCRDYAVSSYRLLIDVIGALGAAVPPQTVEDRQSVDYAQAQLEHAKNAFKKFCDVFKPDRATAYFRERQQNSIDLFFHDKLDFPETMYGLIKSELPVKLIFDEGSLKIYPPFPTGSTYPDTAGRFIKREQVDKKRVIAMRLTWNQSQAALFLNWKTDTNDSKMRPELSAIWEKVDEARQLKDAKARNKAIQKALRPLELSLKYFCGHLAATGVDLSEQYHAKSKARPHELIKIVGEASTSASNDVQAAKLEDALDKAIGLDNTPCNIHWTNDKAMACVPIGDASGQERTFQPHELLIFKQGIYENDKAKTTPLFAIESGSDGLVRRSVCAQSAAWRNALLIENLDTYVNKSRTKKGDLKWSDLRFGRKNHKCKSEIAIPMLEGDHVTGVVNIESARILTRTHMRRAELLTLLFQNLRTVEQQKDTLRDCDRDLITELISSVDQIQTPYRLCKLFCEWVLDALGASLAHIQIYDARVRVFRPMGASVSAPAAIDLLENQKTRTAFGIPEWKDKKTLDPLLKPFTNDTEQSPIHSLIEQVVGGRLLSRRRGNTWKVFISKNPDFFKPKKGELRQYDRTIRSCAEKVLAVPFRQSQDMQAEGVLFASWKGKPDGNLYPELSRYYGSPKLCGSFIKHACERLSPVMEAVAAMYALFRYCDPDAAAEPIPEPSRG